MKTETRAKVACAYSGFVWGLFWIPVRHLDAVGISGLWAIFYFYALPFLLSLPVMVWRWRTIMNRTLEDARAFASEEVGDLMEEFVSPGAVRAVQDKATEAQLKKADEVVERFVYALVRASARQPDGSVVVEPSAIEPAVKAICPVYPFCDR